MLRHALLEACGVAHGFGLRSTPVPDGLLRPRQVHGCTVVSAAACRAQPVPEADGVVANEAGVTVGVVTADCVPVLVGSRSGQAVAALHAGWRGLACGVVASGIDALCQFVRAEDLVAVVGPHIGPCCYEVDAPVLESLEECFDRDLAPALRPARAGHAYLDLGALAGRALERAGLPRAAVKNLPDTCTYCQPERFHSFRRDGARAGRLTHWISTGSPPRET
jgi:hypothetical protein